MEKINEKLKVSLAWMALFIIIADWFQYFLYMLINFFNYAHGLPTLDIILVATTFICPLLTAILLHKPPKEAITKLVLYITIPVSIVLSYLYYLAFFKMGLILDETTGLESISVIVGFLSAEENMTKTMMYIVNAVFFVLVIPFITSYVSKDRRKIEINPEMLLGFIGCCLYMGFRTGSLLSTPLRISITLLIIFGLFLILDIFSRVSDEKESKPSEPKSEAPSSSKSENVDGTKQQINDEQDKQYEKRTVVPEPSDLISLRFPIIAILSFSFGVLTLADFGSYYASSTWFAGLIAAGLIANKTIGKVKTYPILSKIIFVFWIGALGTYCLSGITQHSMEYISITKIALVLSSFAFMWAITNDKFKPEKPIHQKFIYQFFAMYIGLICLAGALLLYFSQPFTNIGIFVVIMASGIYIWKEYI